MKKTKICKALGGVLMGLLLLAGCSDGELKTQEETAAPAVAEFPPPEIVSFGANPLVVEAGATVTLSWEVTGADTVEISSDSTENAFNYSTNEAFESSAVSNPLQEDTTFVLTATKNPPSAEEAKPEEENKEEGATTQSLGKQTAPATPETPEEGAEGGAEEGGEEAPAAPEPKVVTSTVTVRVKSSAASLKVDQFYADAPKEVDGNYSVSPNTKVVLQWSVTPADAVVTLTASSGENPVKVECASEEGSTTTKQMELDSGTVADEYPSAGCATVQPTQTTTYTLTPKLEDQTGEPETLVIAMKEPEVPTPPQPTQPAVDCSKISAAADVGYAFSGEPVRVSWNLPTEVLSLITTVRATDGDQTVSEQANKGRLDIAPKTGIITVSFEDAAGQSYCSKAVGVSVAGFESVADGTAVKVVRDGAEGKGVYVGLAQEGFNGGNVKLMHYKPAAEETTIDFFTPLKGTPDKTRKPFDEITEVLDKALFMELIKTFPINAVAIGPSGRVYVGTTGVMLYKGEKYWEALAPLLIEDEGKTYKGSHPTCFGQTQVGLKPRKDGEIVSMAQVCDMVATADGKMYVATDGGIYSIKDVETYIKDKKSDTGIGSRAEGNGLFGTVVNDIEVAGDTVYVGGAQGVYTVQGDGASVTKVGEGLSGEVYSVAVHSVATVEGEVLTIAAGTSDGLYITGFGAMIADSGTWTKNTTVSGKVYAVAYDGEGKLYAGGESGLYVNGKAVALGGETAPVVRSIAAYKAGDDYYVYLATESGVMRAKVANVGKPAPLPQPTPPAEQPPAEQPAAEQPTVTGATAAGFSAGGSVIELQ